MLLTLLALTFAAYFGSLWWSARFFPRPYDWRYRVMSNLLSPRDNPDGYRVPAVGVALAGLLMLPLTVFVRRHLAKISPRVAQACGWFFLTGLLCLSAAGLVAPQHVHAVFGLRRLHEICARSAAILLSLGMLGSCWCALLEPATSREKVISGTLRNIWLLVTGLPLAGVLWSELLRLAVNGHLTGSEFVQSRLRSSIFWHLPFWEWTGSFAFFVFLWSAVWLLPAARGASSPE